MDSLSIFLDFEGDTKGNFFLAGFQIDGKLEQVILDERLSGLANFRNLRQSKVSTFIEEICSHSGSVKVYGFSMHEREIFTSFRQSVNASLDRFQYVNLLKAAKSWIYSCKKDEFDALPPFRKGATEYQQKRQRKSLASIMCLTNFPSRSDYAPGKTTKRFNMGIKGLVRHSQDYDKLTASQKRDLTQALDHNKYDVEALVVLLSVIQQEHPKALEKATFPLFD
tara:strand:+ start:2336 stop:3007 length:672 start_codon:yes stop_codon:yes gene_type:complete